ncbi:hypothetical protein D3C87_1341820 [compost metagenome]
MLSCRLARAPLAVKQGDLLFIEIVGVEPNKLLDALAAGQQVEPKDGSLEIVH